MSSFISGLIGGYSSHMLEKSKAEFAAEQQDKQNRITVLREALSSGRLTPDAQEAALDQLDEITGAKKGKGAKENPGRQMLSRLVGHASKQQQETLGQTMEKRQGAAGVQRQGGSEVDPTGGTPIPERAPGTPGDASLNLGNVPTRPTAPTGPVKTMKTDQDLADEEISLAKRKSKEVTIPEREQTEAAADKRQQQRDIDTENRAESKAQRDAVRDDQKAKLQEQRENVRQIALDARQRNAQAFQERLVTLREKATSALEMQREAIRMKETDGKAADALSKQSKTMLGSAYNGEVVTLRQQVTQAEQRLKAAETAAAKIGFLGKLWTDMPDTQGAKQDLDNAKASLAFLERNRADVITGKAEFDSVVDQAQDIMESGVPQTPEHIPEAAPTVPSGAKVTRSIDLSKR